jgi:molybdenum cofactor cytidylyltransferase
MRGETLVHRAARLAVEAGFAPVCVALGNAADKVSREVSDLPLSTVFNPDWASGMSTSLRIGVSHILAQDPDLTHLLVLVCDQLGLSAELLMQLRAASARNSDEIVAAEYECRFGVPAIFPAAFLPGLMKTEGDRGARALLEKSRENVFAIHWPEGSLDVDTPEDARRAGLAWDE